MLTVDPVERANADYSIKHPWLRKHNGARPQYSPLDFSNEVITPITEQKSINEMRNVKKEFAIISSGLTKHLSLIRSTSYEDVKRKKNCKKKSI
ncbi:unnamed protein product [Rotaria sordida]|uniref:Uncharacterized protein n=2 Tax=Rotaria sordida TaxID=392033 RepID=A0A815N482_9BILA|nr:unnamed protein product [Rotaria sordida]CAF1632069.1 unnamed protein product [Rotaria sordida]